MKLKLEINTYNYLIDLKACLIFFYLVGLYQNFIINMLYSINLLGTQYVSLHKKKRSIKSKSNELL